MTSESYETREAWLSSAKHRRIDEQCQQWARSLGLKATGEGRGRFSPWGGGDAETLRAISASEDRARQRLSRLSVIADSGEFSPQLGLSQQRANTFQDEQANELQNLGGSEKTCDFSCSQV